MDTAVVQQFLNIFKELIDLCLTENWPNNNTTELELRNAFLLSQHVETCLDKLQKKNISDEFLSVLISHRNISINTAKYYLLDPQKYILQKVINSNTTINVMDVSVKLFLELFSLEKLQASLTDIIVEAASKETLLKNLDKELEKDNILIFKSEVMLLKAYNSSILDIVRNCNETTVEVLVFCLLNSDTKYTQAVKNIKEAILNVMRSRDCVYRNFWRLLFKVDDKYFLEMCINNSDVYSLIVEALLDYGKLLREDLSTDSFYVDLGQTELKNIVRRVCSNESLKSQFLDILVSCDAEVEFWTKMVWS